jgi:hypothetical protein
MQRVVGGEGQSGRGRQAGRQAGGEADRQVERAGGRQGQRNRDNRKIDRQTERDRQTEQTHAHLPRELVKSWVDVLACQVAPRQMRNVDCSQGRGAAGQDGSHLAGVPLGALCHLGKAQERRVVDNPNHVILRDVGIEAGEYALELLG